MLYAAALWSSGGQPGAACGAWSEASLRAHCGGRVAHGWPWDEHCDAHLILLVAENGLSNWDEMALAIRDRAGVGRGMLTAASAPSCG